VGERGVTVITSSGDRVHGDSFFPLAI
jgi:hypothetical protein